MTECYVSMFRSQYFQILLTSKMSSSDSESDTSVTSGTESEDEGSTDNDEEETIVVNDDDNSGDKDETVDENDNYDDTVAALGEGEERSGESFQNNNEAIQRNLTGENSPQSFPSKAPRWNGDRLHPPSRKLLKPSKAWRFGDLEDFSKTKWAFW